jgi:hypothetical protein
VSSDLLGLQKGAEALVLLGAGATARKMGAKPGKELVDGLPGELGLDVAVDLVEALVAVDGMLSGPEQPDENRIGHHVTSR